MITFDKTKDKVSIIAPGSACKDEDGNFDLEKSKAYLEVAVSSFEEHEFSCKYDDKIFAGGSLSYFAAPKEERLRQLKDAIEDREAKIICMLRGGYGCGEIVFDCLEIKPSVPKILIGYSDLTVLHFLFNQHYNLPSIHGTVSEKNKNTLEHMISILSGKQSNFTLSAQNEAAHTARHIAGQVTGGNLTLICNMIGTKLHPSFANKILFLEDVNEKGYQVHRHLLHMSNAGLFKQVKAVVFADFTESDKLIDPSIEHFINNYLHSIPVFKTSGIGHGEINYPLAMSANGFIDNLTFSVESPFKLV
jgi:muramoyltetrapeptide carboxypeptidase